MNKRAMVDFVGGSNNGRAMEVELGRNVVERHRQMTTADAMADYDAGTANLPQAISINRETYVRETIHFSRDESLHFFRIENMQPVDALVFLLKQNRKR